VFGLNNKQFRTIELSGNLNDWPEVVPSTSGFFRPMPKGIGIGLTNYLNWQVSLFTTKRIDGLWRHEDLFPLDSEMHAAGFKYF
jgi:hypothetical protein